MKFSRREMIKQGIIGAAGLGLMGAVDLGLLTRRAVAAGTEPYDVIKNLAYPMFSTPAMLKTGDVFDIRLKTPGSSLSSASLVSAEGKEIMLNPETDGAAWKAQLPPDAAAGVYNLKVSSSTPGGALETETQPRAVSVFNEFKDDFDFVFVSDIHFGEHEGKLDTIATPEMTQYYRLRAKSLMEVEKRNPEFIVIGGDLVLYPKNYRFGYPECYGFLLKYLQRPVHILPGNHDLYHMEVAELGGEHVYGKRYWEKYFGDYYHSFDYGKTHVACVNTTDWPDEFIHWGTQNTTTGTLLSVGIQKEQFNWLKKDLETAKARNAESIVCGHIPFHNIVSGGKFGLPPVKLPGAPEKAIMGVLAENNVKNIIVGHLHKNDERMLDGGVNEIMVRNVGGDFFESEKAGFAVVHIRGGKFKDYELVDVAL